MTSIPKGGIYDFGVHFGSRHYNSEFEALYTLSYFKLLALAKILAVSTKV